MNKRAKITNKLFTVSETSSRSNTQKSQRNQRARGVNQYKNISNFYREYQTFFSNQNKAPNSTKISTENYFQNPQKSFKITKEAPKKTPPSSKDSPTSLQNLSETSSDSDDEEYEVEDVLDEKFIPTQNQVCYKIKWRGYKETTWEPLENLEHCFEKLYAYLLRRNKKLGRVYKSYRGFRGREGRSRSQISIDGDGRIKGVGDEGSKEINKDGNENKEKRGRKGRVKENRENKESCGDERGENRAKERREASEKRGENEMSAKLEEAKNSSRIVGKKGSTIEDFYSIVSKTDKEESGKTIEIEEEKLNSAADYANYKNIFRIESFDNYLNTEKIDDKSGEKVENLNKIDANPVRLSLDIEENDGSSVLENAGKNKEGGNANVSEENDENMEGIEDISPIKDNRGFIGGIDNSGGEQLHLLSSCNNNVVDKDKGTLIKDYAYYFMNYNELEEYRDNFNLYLQPLAYS